MKTLNVIGYEWKLQFGNGASALLMLIFAAVLIYGGLTGKAARDVRSAAISAHHEALSVEREDWLRNLNELERLGPAANVPPDTGSAMHVVFASSLPQMPLADFAVGQSDLLPYVGEISLWNPDIRLFSKYEFANPVALALGGFDISRAIILFLPLLLVVFCFDVIAADRDARRLGLAVVQGGSIRGLFWQRLLFRGALVLILTLFCALLMLVFGQQPALIERLPAFGLWVLLVLAYALFWLLLIAFVASFNRSGVFNMLSLLGLWAGLTLVIPAAGSALAEALYPTPSRLAYLAEAREVENETRLQVAEVANEFMMDHPELLVNQSSRIPSYVKSSYLVTSKVDEATRPIVDEFDDALASREQVLGVFRFLSPAVAVHGLFNELAGTSAERHQQYLNQARQFKADYAEMAGTNIVAMMPVDSEFSQALPRFQFADEPLGSRMGRGLGPIVVLLMLCVVLAFTAHRQLRAASPLDY
ncbi:MAG: DUF3526 domain-containing protein [Gammaproteobacteria bacterium]|nr:DUF3526 domain-containing protein [Gammaproteobacteria bacterium]